MISMDAIKTYIHTRRTGDERNGEDTFLKIYFCYNAYFSLLIHVEHYSTISKLLFL